MSNIKSDLRQMWSIIKKDLWVQYAWIGWVLPFELINIVFGIASWTLFARMFGGTAQVLQQYGGDPLSYVMLGMSFVGFLTYASTGLYQALLGLYAGVYWSGGYRLSEIEYLRLAKISPAIRITANFVLAYFRQILICFVYMVVGIWVFGLKFSPNANLLGALMALTLGVIACLGLGLISASTIWLLGAWHGVEPISWSIGLLTSIVSSVYFPSDVLPSWLKEVSYFLPHTYSMEASKLALLVGYSNDQLAPYFLRLILFSVALMLIGIVLIRFSFKKGEEKGSLM